MIALTMALSKRVGFGDLMYSQLYVSRYVLASSFARQGLYFVAISWVHSSIDSSTIGLFRCDIFPCRKRKEVGEKKR